MFHEGPTPTSEARVTNSARILTVALWVAFAGACGETVAPIEYPPDDYVLPAPDVSLDPERLSVGETIATPCAFGIRGNGLAHLRDRHEWALVDIFFYKSSPTRGPREDELQLVRDHGGRVLHAFQVPAVRARMILSRIPHLVAAGSVVVRDVPDATRYDVPRLSVGFYRLTDEHVDVVASLGGRVTHRHDFMDAVAVDLPDVSIRALVERSDVRWAHMEVVGCLM